MNSKERVRTALAHREPDHVPLGEIEIDGPIVEAVLGRPTFFRGGMRTVRAFWEGRRDEVAESMTRDYAEFIRKTEMDIVCINSLTILPDKDAEIYPPEQVGPIDWRDANGNVFRYSEMTQEFMLFKRGTGPVRLIENTHPAGKPWAYTESELQFARSMIEQFGQTHFIVAPSTFTPPILPHRGATGNLVESVVNAVMNGEMDLLREQGLRQAPHFREAAQWWKAFGADAVQGGQDIGTNQGTFISPAHVREMLLPVWAMRAEQAHAAGLPIFWHACGNNRGVWDQYVEAGMDVYQAIQDEEPLDALKLECGARLTLMGGVSCRLLDIGTPDQIRAQTSRSLEIAREGGGFILASSHSLGVGVKYENFMAMLETWHKYR